MPHCRIEYAEPIASHYNMQQAVVSIHQAIIDSQLFDVANIKSRAIPTQHYMCANSASDTYVHVSIAILPGRSDAQKLALSSSVLETLKNLFNDVNNLSVEINELHASSYQKASQ